MLTVLAYFPTSDLLNFNGPTSSYYCVGHSVRKINYLGDWGTQFGFLMAGIQHFNVDIEYFKETYRSRFYKKLNGSIIYK